MPERYVLQRDGVRDSLKALVDRKIHRTFPGYLCLKETSTTEGRLDNLQPNFASFFDRYLTVGDASPKRPYVVPFQDRGSPNYWLNKNVAGSYAGSSLRAGTSPLLRVADVFGARAQQRFSLKANNADLAREAFCHGMKVPVLPLATFLFRDFAFDLEDEEGPPDVAKLISVFRNQFGFRYSHASEASEYTSLFVETGFPENLVGFEKLPQNEPVA